VTWNGFIHRRNVTEWSPFREWWRSVWNRTLEVGSGLFSLAQKGKRNYVYGVIGVDCSLLSCFKLILVLFSAVASYNCLFQLADDWF
jgi:hypothetical protein